MDAAIGRQTCGIGVGIGTVVPFQMPQDRRNVAERGAKAMDSAVQRKSMVDSQVRPSDVTEAELAVLQNLWGLGTTTIRDLVGLV